MNQETMQIIKSTVPVLREHGVAITTRFYQRMFENNAEVAPMFDMARQRNGEQPKALAMAVMGAAENIENLSAIMPLVQNIGARHVACGVKPEHYPIVGSNLLAAIKEVLGDAATDDIMKAWEEAWQKSLLPKKQNCTKHNNNVCFLTAIIIALRCFLHVVCALFDKKMIAKEARCQKIRNILEDDTYDNKKI